MQRLIKTFTVAMHFLIEVIRSYLFQSFSIDRANLDTIVAIDPLYQKAMGQRTGLSFFDIKLANLEYCNGVCT